MPQRPYLFPSSLQDVLTYPVRLPPCSADDDFDQVVAGPTYAAAATSADLEISGDAGPASSPKAN